MAANSVLTIRVDPLKPGGSSGLPIVGLHINSGVELARRTAPTALRTAQKFSVRTVFPPMVPGTERVSGGTSDFLSAQDGGATWTFS